MIMNDWKLLQRFSNIKCDRRRALASDLLIKQRFKHESSPGTRLDIDE